MAYLFTPPPLATVAVKGSNDKIAVHRVYCVGRNYAEHAREMGHNPDCEPPFFFCKPSDAVRCVRQNECYAFPYPMLTKNLHYEGELVAVIGKSGVNISVKKALDYVLGYAIGLDMTRRDLQNEMKSMGRPWEIGKAFDHSAPISEISLASEVGHLSQGNIRLWVNGEERQSGNLNQLIWSVAEIVSYLSTYFTLQPGDLIFTGTPKGVGKVEIGDQIVVAVDKLGELKVDIV